MNGTTSLRHSVGSSGIGEPVPVATLVIYQDETGYGMKVTGDNPVYVQSVKEGGAAARAGLRALDRIIKVNGVNVMHSTHIEVVELIKSSTQVVLTVQPESVSTMTTRLSSPSQHHRPTSLSTSSVLISPVQTPTSLNRVSNATATCTERITGPQPVDHEKRRQLETQRVLTLQLMLENEKNYVDKLRSELAKAAAGAGNANNIASLQTELANAERRLKKLQEPLDQLCSLVTNVSSPMNQHVLNLSCSGGGGDAPPPLPSRKSLSVQSLSPPPLPPRPPPNSQNVFQSEPERHLTPPIASGVPNSFSQGAHLGSSISLNKHQRTKSSPEQLGAVSPAEASRRLIASESMSNLGPPGFIGRPGGRHSGIDLDELPGYRTPPGTPPPPYPAPILADASYSNFNENIVENFNSVSSPRSHSLVDGSNPGLLMIQQPIMSMEDDDMSDQEVGQLEDHGPFKLLSRLWQHHAHLSVFINYVLSNSDPSSLLFYLITDLYKEGNAKEMRKWAYEIHSSFLVPGAPLRLNNVDENVAREIDDVLLNESGKEEILRKIFWKARNRAKEELNEQLTDFQQKRTAGLGTLFGPSDAQLDESACDKSRETKIIETYLLPKMETYLEDIEKENVDQRKFTTAASLATVLTKVFQVRPISLDRVPTFVAKDKSHIKSRLSATKARKMAVRGHHFVAHQYFIVTYCNHCQFIIGGIGPQGYQCGNCSLNVHRQCVRVVEENCPGPLVKKEKGNDRISKLMERILPEKKPPSHHSQSQMHFNERIKRCEEESSPVADGENAPEGQRAAREKRFFQNREKSVVDPTMLELHSPLLEGLRAAQQQQQQREHLDNEPNNNNNNNNNTSSSSSSNSSSISNNNSHSSSSNSQPDDADSDEDDSCSGSSPSPVAATPRAHKLRFSERCRSRLLHRNFKAKSALSHLHHHRAKDTAQRRSSTIARVWDTLATVRWSNHGGRAGKAASTAVIGAEAVDGGGDPFIAKLELLKSTADADLGDDGGEHRGSGLAGSARGGGERGGRISGFGSSDHADSMDDPSSREDISEMVQQNISSKPKTSNINRSESYKERIHNRRQLREKRKTSDPNLSKTNDCDAASGAFPGNSAGSSSNSSLSTRSLDSPSTSLEQVHPASASASASWDSDVDVEPDPPDWSQGVAEDVLARLSNSEKKRQEVINELFHTERSHVRALKVLSQVFHKPLLESQVLHLDQIHLLFSNLDEMVTLHSHFNQAMKRKKKENPCVGDIGDLLLDMFDGEAGEIFERAASKYCAKQQVALRALRDQRRKDPKLNSFLNEVEANPMCRRLQLKDHILTGMLRLTKYPLLFDNLAKYTSEENEKERAAVLRSLERSREILSRVNQAVRETEDYYRLAEIQRTIDRSAFDKFEHPTVQEFKNLDITKRKLIYEGPLQWRVVKAKPVDLHVVLLDDTILLLHRQDDKYALKFINQMNSVLSPIVRVSTVLVRHNAVDKNSLYLVNTSQNGAQIYDLVASSFEEGKLWYKHISEAAEVHKNRDREGRRPMPPSSSSSELAESNEDQLLPDNSAAASAPATIVNNNNEARTTDKDDQEKRKENSESIESASAARQQQQQQQSETADTSSVSARIAEDEEASVEKQPVPTATNAESVDGKRRAEPEESAAGSSATVAGVTSTGEPLRLVSCTQCSLIDPVVVHVEERSVHVAESALTPIEALRRKDEEIKKALIEKQSIVTSILNIPKLDVEHPAKTIPDFPIVEKEPAELILTAIGQANKLTELLNSALTVTETDAVLATQNINVPTGCETLGCPVPRVHSRVHEPAIPVSTLQPLCNSLASQLSQLLKIVIERDEERERLRKEVHRSRERLHAIDAEAQRREVSEVSSISSETIAQSDYTTIAGNDRTNQDLCNDGHSQDIFVDAQSELDAFETTDIVEEIKVTSDNEVMGDSVG